MFVRGRPPQVSEGGLDTPRSTYMAQGTRQVPDKIDMNPRLNRRFDPMRFVHVTFVPHIVPVAAATDARTADIGQ